MPTAPPSFGGHLVADELSLQRARKRNEAGDEGIERASNTNGAEVASGYCGKR